MPRTDSNTNPIPRDERIEHAARRIDECYADSQWGQMLSDRDVARMLLDFGLIDGVDAIEPTADLLFDHDANLPPGADVDRSVLAKLRSIL